MAMTNRAAKRVCLNESATGLTGSAEGDIDMNGYNICSDQNLDVCSTNNDQSCLRLRENGGADSRVQLVSSAGTGQDSIFLLSTNGGTYVKTEDATKSHKFDIGGFVKFTVNNASLETLVPLDMGTTKITNLEDGVTDTDAINLSQIKYPYITKLQTSVQSLSGFGGLTFDTDVDSRGTWVYDAATGFFTVPEAGMYLVAVHVHLVSGSDTQIAIATDVPAYTRSFRVYGGGNQYGDHVAMFALSSGAKIRVTGYLASGSRNTSSTSTAYQNSISIARVSQ